MENTLKWPNGGQKVSWNIAQDDIINGVESEASKRVQVMYAILHLMVQTTTN